MRRVVLAMTFGVVAANVAYAEPKTDPKAERLFNQGRELMKQENYTAACERFSEALAIDWAPGIAANYGDCLAHLGKIRKAVTMLYEAARAYDRDNDPRADNSRALAEATERKLVKLEITVRDPSLDGLSVTVGSEELTVARRIVERVDPGTVVVSAAAPGYTPFRASIDAEPGETVEVEIPALAPLPAETAIRPRGSRSPGRVRWSIYTGIAGGVAVAVTGVLGYVAHTRYDDAVETFCVRTDGELLCQPQGSADIASAGRYADVATVTGIAGAALVATGVVLYVTAPRVTVSPVTSNDAIGLSIRGRF
ncbi:MAG: hypothetical protein AB7O24_14250 [Kofleriaceae bacterium]